MTKFEAGKTYKTRSICNYDCIISLTVISRTDKTLTTVIRGQTKRLRISEYNGVEQVKPWGSYSMAPIMDATDLAKGELS